MLQKCLQKGPPLRGSAMKREGKLIRLRLEHSQKGTLGNRDRADHLHPLLSSLLLLEELSLPGDIPSVTFRRHVLPVRLDGASGNDLSANGTLDRNLERLARNLLFQPLAGQNGP